MSSLAEFYIKKSTLETMLKVLEVKNQDGISLQIGINDETNKFGQNVSVSVSQSKEDREAKKNKFYIGNGKVFKTDGNIKVAEKVEKPIIAINRETFLPSDDVPF
jgi:hypothetical protein